MSTPERDSLAMKNMVCVKSGRAGLVRRAAEAVLQNASDRTGSPAVERNGPASGRQVQRSDEAVWPQRAGREGMRRRKKVLIVDDDRSVRESLARLLDLHNYEVVLATDGIEATERLCQGSIDVVLLDLMMPKLGGWEAYALLTSINPLLPVVVITARAHQQEAADAAGVDALLEKPLDLPALLLTLEDLLVESPAARFRRYLRAGKRTHLLSQ
jgi:CheY-like chemotaxis protein